MQPAQTCLALAKRVLSNFGYFWEEFHCLINNLRKDGTKAHK
jgi:hypothetical protein